MKIRETLVIYKGPPIDVPKVVSSRTIVPVIEKLIPNGPQERMIVILLDTKNRPVGWSEVARGGATSCATTPSDIFRPAIAAGAVGIIMAHNHPSGDKAPSFDDIQLTNKMVELGETLGVRVLDHIIVTHNDNYLSFLDEGLIGA